IVNGDIDLGAGDDSLAISSDSIVNGGIFGGDGNDNLTLGNTFGKGGHLQINGVIEGFEDISINQNITLGEKAKLNGDTKISIDSDHNLNLKMDVNDKDVNGRIKGHALYTEGFAALDGKGDLTILTNGIGNGAIIAMAPVKSEIELFHGSTATVGGTSLSDSLNIVTDSVIHNALVLDKVTSGVGTGAFGAAGQAGDIQVSLNTDLVFGNKTSLKYKQLNKIYKSLIAKDENINAIYPTTSTWYLQQLIGNTLTSTDLRNKAIGNLYALLEDIYTGSPYSYSNELSRESLKLFEGAVLDNPFKANEKKWMVYGGILHNENDIDEDNVNLDTLDSPGKLSVDNKVTGGYALGEYGFTSTLSGGLILGGSNSKSDLSNGSNVDGDAFYMGTYVKKDIDNWRIIGGLGYQYTDYDTKRVAGNMVQSFSYDKDYSDKSYNIYLSGRYSHDLGNDWFLEPKLKLAYEHISQDGISEDSKPLSMSVDSKDFDIFEGAIGLDIKKVLPLEIGKNSIRAGVSYN
ncbi:MAG: autotransporter outer membrane beta-barrel domain-containing protein, partial [Peptostreptococcaceae bacterium]